MWAYENGEGTCYVPNQPGDDGPRVTTELLVVTDTNEEYVETFQVVRPKALQKLKELAEA